MTELYSRCFQKAEDQKVIQINTQLMKLNLSRKCIRDTKEIAMQKYTNNAEKEATKDLLAVYVCR